MAVLLVGIGGGWLWQRRRRAARSVRARLAQASEALLVDFFLPDTDGGQIHIEFAVRTRQGIVLVELRDVTGHVFGSESMQEWTVLGPRQRFTFQNPLPGLYDRVAAVKRFLPDVPVSGVVAFTAQGRFTKGMPPNVTMIESLLDELNAGRTREDAPDPAAVEAAWGRLQSAAELRAGPARA